MRSSPAIGDDGTVYIGSEDKKVYALDGATGTKKWEFETGKSQYGVRSSPVIGPDGTIYIGSYDKKLYALASSSKGLAKSPWPMFGQNARHTGRASAISNSPEAAAVIEAAIRKAAGKPVGSLTKADKEKVKVLILNDSQISDLTPFSDLNNLEELHLNQNLISDLRPIRNLKNLRRLSLNNNRVVDISPIKGLTKLYAFHVSNNNLTSEGSRVRDLSALKELNL